MWVAREALLELKTAFNATPGALGGWRPADGDPCGWEGISCSFPDLWVQSINLPYMQLGGIISPSIGKLSKLQRLALHQNSLHGPIPLEIKNCTQLRAMHYVTVPHHNSLAEDVFVPPYRARD